ATIRNDDPLPTLTIDDTAVAEDFPPSARSAVFRVTLSHPVGETVTVSFATANGTASGTASGTAGSGDFVPASGLLSFPPDTLNQSISVPVRADTVSEPLGETFFVDLSSPQHATITDGRGVATISDDGELVDADPQPLPGPFDPLGGRP
ncbi:MAG TPA: Calx-beta domain-containing protein, partial [Chloroflexota bacterium]|nr:Calx-beta domain-containing protein [Chloroflexota bacterium]